ncbi:glycosyltransferase [Amycolatopsis sp. NPDC004169]|uniref:glycosyltransferase family 2 protein n=1 Tax=Amycolatopsis sp. NPDC004169 TaxID=3154453 RepID=UPI0033AD4174
MQTLDIVDQSRDRLPAVSCLMLTSDRRQLARRAIDHFLGQDYNNCELIVVDSGTDPIADLIPAGDVVRYHRLDVRRSIGWTRQFACEAASGDVLVQWDDDDWYGSHRLRRQVEPIARGDAEVSALLWDYLYDVPARRFWRRSARLRLNYLDSVVCGTLAFTRAAWQRSAGYRDVSLGEDVGMLTELVRQGARLARVKSDGIFVCVRHSGNTWHFEPVSGSGDGEGWYEAPPPLFLSDEEIRFYNSTQSLRDRW